MSIHAFLKSSFSSSFLTLCSTEETKTIWWECPSEVLFFSRAWIHQLSFPTVSDEQVSFLLYYHYFEKLNNVYIVAGGRSLPPSDPNFNFIWDFYLSPDRSCAGLKPWQMVKGREDDTCSDVLPHPLPLLILVLPPPLVHSPPFTLLPCPWCSAWAFESE